MKKPAMYSSDNVVEEFYRALASEDEGKLRVEYTFLDQMCSTLEKKYEMIQV